MKWRGPGVGSTRPLLMQSFSFMNVTEILSGLQGAKQNGTGCAASFPSPLALRPREAAKALGISPRLLWQLTKDGVIPCRRVGSGKRKTVLYSVAVLQDWLTNEAAKVKGGGNEAN